MASKSYFVSDIHLENMQERNGETLLRFLHSAADDSDVVDIYFLGDIFDFWLSGHKVFVNRFAPLYEPLKKIKEKGGKLVYFEGNHDFHIHPFWKKKLGFEIFTDAEYRKVGDLTVRLEHGDLINPDDIDYLRWRTFYRNPFIAPIAHIIPGKVWDEVGKKLSARSRMKTRAYNQEKQDNIRQMIRDHGKRAFIDRPFDVIVTGHMHVKLDEVFEINGKAFRNINLGSWVQKENPQALCIQGSEVKWIDL